MPEIPENEEFQRKPEHYPSLDELYDPTPILGIGFFNALTGHVALDPKQEKLWRTSGEDIPKFEDWVAKAEGLEKEKQPEINLMIELYPHKIAYINKCIKIINNLDPLDPTSVITYKRAVNKIMRLINGRGSELKYPIETSPEDTESDPRLMQLSFSRNPDPDLLVL